VIEDSARTTTTHRGPWYAEGRWTHLAPILGILAVVLWLAGVILVESGSNSPNSDATGEQIVQYFEENAVKLILGGLVFAVGSALFIAFLAHLRARLEEARDRTHAGDRGYPSPLGTTFFTTGVATVLFASAAFAPQIAGAITADETDGVTMAPGSAETFWNLGDGFFVLAQAMLFVFFLSAALAFLRSRFLPSWLGWVSLALGMLAVIAPIGWAALVFGVPLWTLAVAAFMWVRSRGRDDRMAPPAERTTTTTRTVT